MFYIFVVFYYIQIDIYIKLCSDNSCTYRNDRNTIYLFSKENKNNSLLQFTSSNA